jgi:hypothetical protein
MEDGMKDAIAETREQIGRLMDLEEAHELCLSGFHNPKAHGLLKEWPEESNV